MSGASHPQSYDSRPRGRTPAFRVTASYPLGRERPSEDALADLRTRLDAAAPDAAARVALSAATLDVALTVHGLPELEAINVAVATADAVVSDASIRATAQPV